MLLLPPRERKEPPARVSDGSSEQSPATEQDSLSCEAPFRGGSQSSTRPLYLHFTQREIESRDEDAVRSVTKGPQTIL